MDRLYAVFNWVIDPNNLTAISTLVIAAFTVILAWVGYRQSRLIRKSIDLARREFLASHRPLLAVRFVTLTIVEGERTAIEFGVINIGTSNATVLGSSVNAEFLSDTEWPNPHIYPRNNIVAPRRFVPGATDRYVVPTNELASLIEIYADGLQRLRFYGYIVYRDDTSNTRTTFFCRLYDRDTDRFTPTDQPDYESSD